MAASFPTYVGKGTFASGTGAISLTVPTGIINDDLLIIICESANQAITAPSGWTEVGSQATQSTGTAATAGGVRLAVFWKIAGGLESSVSIADSGDHTTGIMFAVRGADPQNPFHNSASSAAAASTSMTWPTFSTTVANTLILMLTAVDTDLASTATVGNITAANLAGITEIHDQTVIAGAGGGVHAAYGTKATAGALGSMTATGSTSVTHAYLTLAVQGQDPHVRAVGQYKNDQITTIPVGGATGGDGISNEIFLKAEYSAGNRYNPITPKYEKDTVATTFSGTADASMRAMIQADATNPARALRGTTLVYDDVNKRLLQFGGYNGTTRFNTVWERYIDKPGQPWRVVTTTGTPPPGRNLHGATVVKGNLTSGGAVRSYMVIWGGADPSDTNGMWTLRIDTPGSEAWATVTQTSAPSVRSYNMGQIVATPVSGASDQNYIYLYGGWAAARDNGLYRCTFDVDAPTAVTWTTLKSSGAAGNPPQSTGAIMDYKASTGKLYLYGGYDGTTMYNTFWEYDIAGNTWTNTTPTGTAPTGSEAGAGGYDATNNRFWFTGGWTTNGTFTSAINQVGYISNVGGTEAYNVVRASTTNSGNQTYTGLSFPGFAVVPDKGFLYIKSGANCEPSATDMERYGYIIDFNEPGSPTSNYPVYGENEGEFNTARDAPASIVDPVTNEWLMIGGFDDMYDDASGGIATSVAFGTHSNDIWAYNPTTNTWRFANAGWKGLPPMEGRTVVYDSTRDRFILFGGLTAIGMNSNEVWTLTRDANNDYVAAPLYPTGTPPSDRWLQAAVYDAANDRMIIAMGGDNTGPLGGVFSLSFTGSADGAWTTLSPTGSPTNVTGMGFANKASAKRLYIFGGATNSALTVVSGQLAYLDYSTTNCAWTVVSTTGGVSRRTPSLAYDAGMDRLVVFGGFNGTSSLQGLGYLNLATTVWEVPSISGTLPDARRSAAAEFIDGVYYLTHGRSDSGMWYRNTWSLKPDYVTVNNSIWSKLFADSYNPIYYNVTGLTNSTGYHWQAWLTENSVDSTKDSYYTGEAKTYYFDSSDAYPLDANSVWSNKENAFDGQTTTYANGTTNLAGTYLMKGEGTNAPTYGPTIKQVRLRLYSSTSSNGPSTVATVYTDNLGQNLGNITRTTGQGTTLSWSDWTALSTPTGGWTWSKLKHLEVTIQHDDGVAGSSYVGRVELEVTTGQAGESFNDFYVGTPSPSAPSVTANAATDIDLTKATANAEVTADNNGAITERGFVLALQASSDPTTSTNIQKITVVGTTGTFSAQFTGLDPNTAYKYRPYAINSAGTTYGTAQNFTTSDFKTYVLYAVLQNTGGGETWIGLYNRTDGTLVPDSEMYTSSPSPVLVTKQLSYNATNFVNSKDYEFRVRASGGTANVYSAGMYIKLKALTKITTHNRISRFGYQALSAAAAATSERFLYTAGNYSSPSTDWIVTGTEDTNGTNNFQVYNVTTTDSGTTGSGVAGTSIDVNSTSKTWATVTGVTMVDTNRYMGIFNFTSGGARYHQGILAITSTGTVGNIKNQTQIELLDTARSSQLGINYEPDSSKTPFRTTNFDGATYYFEVIGTNSHASNAYGVTLVAYNAAGVATDVVTQNLNAATGSSNVRYRTASITIPSDTVEVRTRIAGTAAAKNVILQGARVIVVQNNPSKSLVHIPMGGSNNESNDDAIWPIVSTTQNTYSTLATNVDQFTIFRRDDSKFADYYEVSSAAQITVSHTTDANKKKASNTVSHTTSANKKKSGFTVSHTTSSNRKKTFTKTHTTDSYLTPTTKVYSRSNNVSIPTNDNNLSTIYSASDYTNVATSDNVRVGITGADYIIHLYKDKSPNTSYSITLSWEGQSTLAPSESPIYLEVYNRTSSTWEVLDYNDSAAANVDIFLTGNISTGVANYYDASGWVSSRVRQFSL